MLNILVGTITMAAALRMAVPLILSSIGGCFGDRTGIFNIALESFMLCAAFFATLGTYYSGSPYVGVLCGILAGLACAVLFGTLVFHLGSSGMVVSIAMNLGMDAFTSFLLLNLFGKRGSFMDPRLVSLPVIKLPLISRIPYVGEVLGAHNIVVYLTLLAVAGTWIAMYKTPFGLRLRSVGINETAAQTTGTNVLRYKWYSVLITGFFVGIAGAILPLGGTSIFTENMSAGRGFLAVAAIMIAKGNPVMAAVYSFMFAYAQALAVPDRTGPAIFYDHRGPGGFRNPIQDERDLFGNVFLTNINMIGRQAASSAQRGCSLSVMYYILSVLPSVIKQSVLDTSAPYAVCSVFALGACRFFTGWGSAGFSCFRFFWAVESMSLIRLSWFTSLAPGS